jgi:hypothetical protein
MSDLLADAREWLATQGDRVQTHSGECHRWHPACLVSRLVRELSRAGLQNANNGNDPERERTPNSHATPGEGTRQKRCIVARLRAEIAWEADVGELLAEAAEEIERLREAIRRLADQDATLSVVGGNVIVEMDGCDGCAVDDGKCQ